MRIVGRDAIAAVVRTLVAAEARIRIDVGEEIAAGGVAHARTRMVIEIVGQPLISLAGEVVYIHEEDGWKILIDRVSSSAMV